MFETTKTVIVNGDDFGLTPGVNRGIIDSHRKGILTSTTTMVNMPFAAEGLALAAREAPNLGIGLHIVLTAGRPVSAPEDVPTLVDADGIFHHINTWPQHIEDFDPDDLRREIGAQVAQFEALAGRAPDHIDSHHHAAFLHPASLRALLDHSQRLGIPLRQTPLNVEEDAAVTALTGILQGITTDFARQIIINLRAALGDDAAPFCPARFESGFFAERATLGDLLVILTTLPDNSVTEVMCHPGYVDEHLQSAYRQERADEVAHLTHAATRECVQSEGIRLVTFADAT